MEMTILGSRHFLLFAFPIKMLSPKLRFCEVRKLLGFVKEFSIVDFDIFGNPLLSKFLNLHNFFCSAYFCLKFFYLLQTQEILMEIVHT
jgi:hypothetical protein